MAIETGKSLRFWQERPRKKFIEGMEPFKVYLSPSREVLYSNSDIRFDGMMHRGVVNEVSFLSEAGVSASVPSMTSHGIPEIVSYIRGLISKEEAVLVAKKNIRHYIKRQLTWFNNQICSDINLESSCPKRLDINKLKI